VKSPSEPLASRRQWLVNAAGIALGALAAGKPGSAEAQAGGRLARIRERGHLLVGLYQEMPPFHVGGSGIDVELGKALARELGVGFSPLPFQSGESMDDDLRNMVWKGHYLGWGPADVLLHVPVERPLMQANPQVQIVAPYYRERVLLAFDADRLPHVDNLADLQGHRVAVAGLSLAGWLLAGAEGGALKERLVTTFADGVGAAQALREGRVDAVAGLASELESVLAGDSRYVLQALPSPRLPRDGWAVGCAVRKDADDLALALQQALQALQASGRLQTLFAQSRVSWHL